MRSSSFGVPSEFSPSELLNKKVDANRDPYYAGRATQTWPIVRAAQLLGMAPNTEQWDELVQDTAVEEAFE